MAADVGFVLVPGAGLSAWIWDGLVRHLSAPAVAVDLPGRGARPLPRRQRTLDGAVAAVLEDAAAIDAGRLVVVGHSLAGVVALPAATQLGDRLAGVALVSADVPDSGTSMLSSVSPGERLFLRVVVSLGLKPPRSAVKKQLANDVDDPIAERIAREFVPEGRRIYTDPVQWWLPDHCPRVYVKLLRDNTVKPDQQDRHAARFGATTVPTLDAGHLPMLSRPQELAAVLNRLV